MSSRRMCVRCICDTTIPGIRFDENGVCNFCAIHDELDKRFPLNEVGQRKLDDLVARIKSRGKRDKYDCVVGVSGGTDSSYLLYVAVELGLRPLAVHVDNGWDSDIAIGNLEKVVSKLGVDLQTVDSDWKDGDSSLERFLSAVHSVSWQ